MTTLTSAVLQCNCKYKWEEQFVFLKQGSADIVVHADGKVLIQVLDSLFKNIGFLAVIYRLRM